MKKTITLITSAIVCICAFHSNVYAQKWKPGFTVGGNLIYSMPSGDFANAYKYGGGGEIFGGIGLGKTYLIATAGASAYRPEGNQGTLTYVPVKIGLKQYFLLNKLFLNGDIGTASIKVRDVKSNQFTIGLGAGARLLGLEAGLYLASFKNPNAKGYFNSLNAKVGWSFKI